MFIPKKNGEWKMFVGYRKTCRTCQKNIKCIETQKFEKKKKMQISCTGNHVFGLYHYTKKYLK